MKKAEMGMGTLIIFIAMILVAAVASSVLIQTTGSLQSKALDTGRSARSNVGTSLHVVEVYGENSSDQSIEELVVVMKLGAGSEPINFEDLLVTLSLDNSSAEYNYDEYVNSSIGINCEQSLKMFDAGNTSLTRAGIDFGVSYTITGPNNRSGYLTRGDVIKLCFESPRKITESETIKINFIPRQGTAKLIEVTTPDMMLSQRESIFP